MKLLRLALIGLPASALILALAAPQSHAVSQTKKDIEDLQKNVFIIQSEISDLKTAVDKLPSAEAISQIRQAQADLSSQLNDLMRDLQVLTGRFEESRYFTDSLLKETSAKVDILNKRVDSATGGITKEESENLISRIARIETGLASIDERLTALEQATGNLPSEKASTEPGAQEKTPEDAYEIALDTFKKNKYGDARKMMAAFLKEYPDHKLAGNAQYWLAETFYADKEYADAILAYEDLLQKYKGHAKISAALLKQALAFIEMGDQKAARGILKELIEKYPESEQAKTAKEKLSALAGGNPESSGSSGPQKKPAEKK